MHPERPASQRHWLKVLLIGSSIAIVLIVCLVAGGLMYLRGDPARLEPVLEWTLSRVFNRQLLIDEVIEAEFAWDASVRATGVSLANPDWSRESDFISASELAITLNLPSLWQDGPIIIHSLQLTRPQVNLERVDDQSATWDLWPAEEGSLPVDDDDDDDDVGSGVFPVILLDVVVTEGTLTYKDNDQELHGTLSGAIAENPGDGLLQLDFDGHLNATPLKLDGLIGPIYGLLGGSKLQLDVNASWGQLQLLARGSIVDLHLLAGPDLSLEVSAPSSRLLLDALGMPEVRDGPLDLDAVISHDDKNVTIVASGSLEKFELAVDAEIADLLAVDGIELDYELAGPSLQELGFMFDIAGMPDVSYAVSGHAYRRGTLIGLAKSNASAGDARLTIDAQLPAFPEINDWQASVEGEGFNLALIAPLIGITELPAVPYGVAAELKSDENGVELLDVVVTGENSALAIKGIVGEAPDFVGTNLTASLTAGNMATFGKTVGLVNLPPESFSFTAKLRRLERAWQIEDSLFSSASFNLAISGVTDTLIASNNFSGNMQASTPDLAATLKAYGAEVDVLRGFPLDLKAKFGGSPTRLLVSDATIISGSSSGTLEGIIGDPLTLEGLDLTLSAGGPDLLEFLPVIGDAPDLPLPFKFSGHVFNTSDGFKLSDVSASLAGGNVSLEGILSNQQSFSNSAVSLTAGGDNFDQVFAPWLGRELPIGPFTFNAKLVYLPPLIQIERLSGDIAGNKLEANFDIEGEGAGLAGQGSVHLSGSSSQSLTRIFGIGTEETLPDKPYIVNAKLKGNDNTFYINPLTINHGKSDLSGTVSYDFLSVPRIEARLQSNYVDLTYLLPSVDELEADQAKQIAAGTSEPLQTLTDELTKVELAERVIPDIKLDFDWLQRVQGSLAYTAKAVDIQEDLNAVVELALDVDNGKLTVESFSWDGPRAEGEAMASITNQGESSTFDVYLRSHRIPLIWMFLENIAEDQETLYRLRISGNGASLDEWVGSLNGAIAFRGGGGRMNNRGMDLFLGDIVGEVFDKLVPTNESEPYTNLECHAGAALFKEGVMEVVPGLAIRTDKVDVVASGRLNLRNEKLDIAFNTRSRKGVGISVSKAITPYVKLGGNLANPQLAFDAKGAAVSGGAAVATGGLSILAEGMWDRWVATSRNPCKALEDSAQKDTRRAYNRILAEPAPGSF